MKHQFLILITFAIILYFISACSKTNEQLEYAESQNHTNELATSYREKIKARVVTTKTAEKTKKSIEKPIEKPTEKSFVKLFERPTGNTIQEKISNLRIFSTDDLLSSTEIALLSPEDTQEYITKLRERAFDVTEKISLDIYNYLLDTGLFNLCDSDQKHHFLNVAAGYVNNQGKGFDEVYKMYDDYLQNNNLSEFELIPIAWSYMWYLNDSQDYQKWYELLNGPFKEIADRLKTHHYYSIGKMTEPFFEYQAKIQNFLLNADKSSRDYDDALSGLAERMAREELYPDDSFIAKNIKKHGRYSYSVSSNEDPTKRMFTEFRIMMDARNKGFFYNPDLTKKYAELDRYIEAYSNAHKKLVSEFGEPTVNHRRF